MQTYQEYRLSSVLLSVGLQQALTGLSLVVLQQGEAECVFQLCSRNTYALHLNQRAVGMIQDHKALWIPTGGGERESEEAVVLPGG